jgi:hypothetical protein
MNELLLIIGIKHTEQGCFILFTEDCVQEAIDLIHRDLKRFQRESPTLYELIYIFKGGKTSTFLSYSDPKMFRGKLLTTNGNTAYEEQL